jgi:hypothetical protein
VESAFALAIASIAASATRRSFGASIDRRDRQNVLPSIPIRSKVALIECLEREQPRD